MATFAQEISWTRLSGELAHALPLLAIVVLGWKRGLGSTSLRRLVWVAVAQLALLLDMIWNWRWLLHDFLVGDAAAHRLYEGRRPTQVLVLEVLGFALVFASAAMVFRLRATPGLSIATAGTILPIGLWCTEIISYHNMDRILYHFIGPLMAVSFLWLLLGAFTTAGVWMVWAAGDDQHYRVHRQVRAGSSNRPSRGSR